jgi:hypothetical protein
LTRGLQLKPAATPHRPQVHDALEAQQHLVSEQAADLFWRLRQWPLRLAQGLEDAALRMAGYRGGFQEQLARDQLELGQALEQLQVGPALTGAPGGKHRPALRCRGRAGAAGF